MKKTMDIENARLYKYCGNDKEVRVPEGVTSIEPKAFFKSPVEEVWLPDSLISIHRDAFRYSKLRKVHFGNGLTGICENAFSNCDLKTVELPDSICSVAIGAFTHTDEVRCSHFFNGADWMFYPSRIYMVEMPETYTAIMTIGTQSLRVPRDMEIQERDLEDMFRLEALSEERQKVVKENRKKMYSFASTATKDRLRTGVFFSAAEMAVLDNNIFAANVAQSFKSVIEDGVKTERDKKALVSLQQKGIFEEDFLRARL